MKHFIAMAVIVLGGCAQSVQWSRPNADTSQLRADLNVCRDFAGGATERDQKIGLDIDAVRGGGRVNISELLRNDIRGYDATRLYHDAVDACMRARGYRLTSDAI